MITVNEAKQLIKENSLAPKVELLSLNDCHGMVLAEDVHATIDTPPFNQSAMDGYAFSFKDWDGHSELKVVGEIQAGNYLHKKLQPFEAIRIFTGAALPEGADTVVMQEKVTIAGNRIAINDKHLCNGTNVRLKGSQARQGEVLLHQGHLLTPASIAFLASNGIHRLKVFAKPKISIIVTGRELVQPGLPITEGQVYDSNSFAIRTALHQLDIQPVSIEIVDDNPTGIEKAIASQLQNDILILTGGVSSGDYDFVVTALERCGVKKIFHKVKQKPGKPFYFGRYNHTLIFALPGNPAAALTCFYIYVVPAISALTKKNYLKKHCMPLADDFRKKAGLTFWMKGKTSANEVKVLNNQESYLMNSYAMADCLIELEENKEYCKKGDLVKVVMII